MIGCDENCAYRYAKHTNLFAQLAEQKQTAHVSTGPILDWCFTYGAKPSLFIATELAW